MCALGLFNFNLVRKTVYQPNVFPPIELAFFDLSKTRPQPFAAGIGHGVFQGICVQNQAVRAQACNQKNIGIGVVIVVSEVQKKIVFLGGTRGCIKARHSIPSGTKVLIRT